jgi:hypothetical protein
MSFQAHLFKPIFSSPLLSLSIREEESGENIVYLDIEVYPAPRRSREWTRLCL